MTTAAASPHVTRATKRLIEKHWLTKITHLPGYAWIQGHICDEYLVPSEEDEQRLYLVQIGVGGAFSRCECQDEPGRRRSAWCKHRALVVGGQTRISNEIQSRENQTMLTAIYA